MMLQSPVIILPRKEAFELVRDKKFVTAKGKRPIGIGLIDRDTAVLLFRTPSDECTRTMHEWVIEYTAFHPDDADPDL